jgi:hypothetical protein
MLKIYYSSIYFKSIAEGLGWVIQRYNKTIGTNKEIEIVDIISKSNSKSKNIKWIILGLQNTPIIPLGKYIVWNFEQFEIDGPIFDQQFWNSMNGASEIWDYSKENIKWLKFNKELEALHLPLGWLPQMKISTPINSWDTRKNTFAFVGLMNERRRDILKPCYELAKTNQWNMYLSNKCWGAEYDTIYSMTKFGINIHFYSGKTILEVHRIIPLILNEIWVITEKSGDPWYDELFDPLVTWANTNTFAKVLNELNQLEQTQIDEQLKTRKRTLIQTCDMYKYFLDEDLGKKLV